MPRLAEGLAKAGRQRKNYEISGGGFLATGPDDATVARTFEWVRERVAFYGSTQAYWPVLALHGLEDLGRKLNAMTRPAGNQRRGLFDIAVFLRHLSRACGPCKTAPAAPKPPIH